MRVALSILLIAPMFLSACSDPPSVGCVVAGFSAKGDAGIFPNTKVSDIVPFQCENIRRVLQHQKCDTNVYRFIAAQPEAAMRGFVPGGFPISKNELEDTSRLAKTVTEACNW